MPDSKSVLLDRFEAEITEDLLARLLRYACYRAKRRSWYDARLGTRASGDSQMPMAEGLQPEDIVHQAVAKTIDGSLNGPGRHRRPWDGQRDLFDHLTSVIDSETSNLAEGWSNQRFRRAELLNSNLDDDSAIGFFDSQPDTTGLSPEGYALQTEKEARAERFVWGFLESLEGEKILLSITEEILDGATKPGEIASALGIPVAEVYAAKKRLKRRLSEYRLNVSTTEEVING